MKKIKVLLVDDHDITLLGFQFLLEAAADMEIIGKATNGAEAVKIVQTIEIDVVVLDIEMPVMDGIEATRRIKALNKNIKVLIVSMHNEIHMIKQLIGYDISGYLLKGKAGQVLVKAIRKVFANKYYFMKEVKLAFVKGVHQPTISTPPISVLTKKEVKVLSLVAEGYTSVKIGKEMDISVNTVNTHRRNLLRKLRLSHPSDLVRYAMKNNLV